MPEGPTSSDGATGRVGADPVGSTTRSCYLKLTNSSGQTITNVTLTHSSGDVNDTISQASMNNGDSSPSKQISYETGFNADFDYWNVSFSIGSTTYATPNNDRCNIESEDAGQTINCQITTDGPFGGDYNLYVEMPKSSSCNFRIDPT